MSNSFVGLLHYTKPFWPIMMKGVTANVPFVFLVVTWKHFPLENLWVLCYVHPLSAFMLLHSSFWLGLYRRQVSAPFVCGVNILLANNKCCSILFSCQLCHSNELESLFECEVSRLLYDEGEVEYWMYEPVDLTAAEQSSAKAATGATMQGEAVCTSMVLCFYHTV